MITTVNLPNELHNDLKHVAEAEHRSANATIVVAVAQYVQNHDKRVRVRKLADDILTRDRELLDRLKR
jgi:predicted transcriptional regulator